ncbi:MAG TPA: nitrilase-related carbon-nitrogen hydrolase, partial [Candidatus Binataceae bacterium]|nr:nitrilase-related carbon-nitrogen hydrolase [Candidatus Binataceae bacterium]
MLAATFAAPTKLRARLCAFLPLFLGGFGEWASEYFFLSIPAFVLVTAIMALMVGALALIARNAACRSDSPLVSLVFPILYAALNFVLSRALYDGTWGNAAYREATFVPLLQIASIAGLTGVVFAMTLPAAALALAWYRAEIGKPWQSAAAVPFAIFAGILTFGTMRIATAPHRPTVRVAMLSSDRDERFSRSTDETQAAGLLSYYASLIPNASAQHAQVVVLPEKIVGVTPADRDALVKVMSAAASASKVWIVAGVNLLGPHHLNSAWIFSPDGSLAGEYNKHYFVRGFEAGYEKGAGIYTVDAPWGKSAVAICKDLDYPPFIRSYGHRDTQLMFVPAWDWVGPNADEHERMSFLRGVENGFAMARSAKDGYVTAHDAYGRLLASSSTFVADPAMVVADMPVGPGPTLYTRFGDWFGWLSIIASAAILLLLVRPKRAFR